MFFYPLPECEWFWSFIYSSIGVVFYDVWWHIYYSLRIESALYQSLSHSGKYKTWVISYNWFIFTPGKLLSLSPITTNCIWSQTLYARSSFRISHVLFHWCIGCQYLSRIFNVCFTINKKLVYSFCFRNCQIFSETFRNSEPFGFEV